MGISSFLGIINHNSPSFSFFLRGRKETKKTRRKTTFLAYIPKKDLFLHAASSSRKHFLYTMNYGGKCGHVAQICCLLPCLSLSCSSPSLKKIYLSTSLFLLAFYLGNPVPQNSHNYEIDMNSKYRYAFILEAKTEFSQK